MDGPVDSADGMLVLNVVKLDSILQDVLICTVYCGTLISRFVQFASRNRDVLNVNLVYLIIVSNVSIIVSIEDNALTNIWPI